MLQQLVIMLQPYLSPFPSLPCLGGAALRLYVGARVCPTERGCSTVAERGERVEHDGKEGQERDMVNVGAEI